MSRNFELLQAVEQAQDFFAPVFAGPEARTASVKATESVNAKDDGVSVLPSGDSELLKLVQRVFLTGSNGSAVHRVVFCGVDERTASSQVCGRVSKMLADQVSFQVCVVDAWPDARPGAPQTQSTSEPVASSADTPNPAQQLRSNLWMLPAKSNGNGGANSDTLRSKIRDLSNDFKYVLIDAPPLASRNDAVLLGRETDGVILVIEAHSTRRAAAQRAKEALDGAEVRLLGTVLNNRTFPIPEKLYRKL